MKHYLYFILFDFSNHLKLRFRILTRFLLRSRAPSGIQQGQPVSIPIPSQLKTHWNHTLACALSLTKAMNGDSTTLQKHIQFIWRLTRICSGTWEQSIYNLFGDLQEYVQGHGNISTIRIIYTKYGKYDGRLMGNINYVCYIKTKTSNISKLPVIHCCRPETMSWL